MKNHIVKLSKRLMFKSLLVIITCLWSCNAQNKGDHAQLKNELESIFDDDQKYRTDMEELAEKHGWKSRPVDSVGVLIQKQDSINLQKVSNIIDKYGWLGVKEVGEKANATIFLVIQHANFEYQQKYLPLMREAVKNDKAKGKDLAYLEDRVALKNGEKQIYGTQIGNDWKNNKPYVRPLIDPVNANARRLSVGLNTLEEYLENWNMSWDPEEYSKNLEYYQSLEKPKNN